jgi:tetratricopeptide (TPR) repeat protein
MLYKKTCSFQQQDCTKAVAAFRKVITYNPTRYQVFIDQGNLLETMQEFDQAIATYTQLIQAAPEAEETIIAHGNRAMLYLNQGKFQQAAKDLEVACRDNTNLYYSYWLSVRGRLELMTEKPEKAQNTFQKLKAIEQDQDTLKVIVEDLNKLAQQEPRLKSTIDPIIAQLAEEKMPK